VAFVAVPLRGQGPQRKGDGLCGDGVAVGVEDAVEGFDAAAVCVDVGHDDGEVVGVVADVLEQPELPSWALMGDASPWVMPPGRFSGRGGELVDYVAAGSYRRGRRKLGGACL
jgi:hypothetical protein